MNDENNEAAGQGQGSERSYGLQRVYLKDVSFESPRAPEVFQTDWKPALTVNIGTRARPVGDNLYEVVVTLNVEAKQEDSTAFLVELQQAGLFALNGFNEEEMKQVLGILCPQNLYPFAREEVANLTMKGGFPQILLQPVNFERMYQQNMQQQQNKPAQGEA